MVAFQYAILCIFQVWLEKYDCLKSARPAVHKSEVVGQNLSVVYVWVCQEMGVAMYKVIAFCFQSYLHNHIPKPHILKTCELWLASYGPKYTLHYHLKSTKPVAGKSKVVRPGSRCGICMGSWGKWVSPEALWQSTNYFHYFSILIYTCDHTPGPHVLKAMKECGKQMWILQHIQTEKLKW